MMTIKIGSKEHSTGAYSFNHVIIRLHITFYFIILYFLKKNSSCIILVLL